MSGEDERREEARRVIYEASAGPVESEGAASGASELKEVLGAISEFLSGLSGPLERLIDTFLRAVDGKKLGADVAAFYESLREAGMPEDLAAQMTKEYFEKRLTAFDIAKLVEKFIRKEVLEESGGEEG
jgi:hypothetical protein